MKKIKPTIIESRLDIKVKDNFEKNSLRLLIFPLVLLLIFACFLAFYTQGSFANAYIDCQKNLFVRLNEILSVYPNLENNITQLGNALIIFPFVLIFLFVSPKLWEVLLTSSIFTLIISAILKNIFAIPRPASVIDNTTFTIIGRPNILHTSFPSGHSMTVFAVITVLLYAFMPEKKLHKVLWSFFLIAVGLMVAFSRVAVGAHYPLDVITGSIIGYITVILSIRINKNLNWLCFLENRRIYPIILLILSVWVYLIILKILKYDLTIFYLSLLALMVSFVVIANKYVKKVKT